MCFGPVEIPPPGLGVGAGISNQNCRKTDWIDLDDFNVDQAETLVQTLDDLRFRGIVKPPPAGIRAELELLRRGRPERQPAQAADRPIGFGSQRTPAIRETFDESGRQRRFVRTYRPDLVGCQSLIK